MCLAGHVGRVLTSAALNGLGRAMAWHFYVATNSRLKYLTAFLHQCWRALIRLKIDSIT